MPAPKHKPNAIHKPTLSVALPIIIPASNPIPAPKDILDSFMLKLVFSYHLFIFFPQTHLLFLDFLQLNK